MHFTSLVLADHDVAGKFLAVGMGPPFNSDKTEYGDCTVSETCDASVLSTMRSGVFLYDISGPSYSVVDGLVTNHNCNPLDPEDQSCEADPPLALSMYQDDGDDLVITSACNQFGLQVLRATFGNFDIEHVGDWNEDDPVATGSFDSVIAIGSNAFASYEQGIAVFDITEQGGQPASDLLSTFAANDTHGGVILAGVPANAGFPTMVFASGKEHGVVFYQVNGSGANAEIMFRGYLVPDRAARTYAVAALPVGQTPDGFPWLIAINGLDTATTSGCPSGSGVNGSVVIYRIKKDWLSGRFSGSAEAGAVLARGVKWGVKAPMGAAAKAA
jgi:hypothetical protein